LASLGNTAVGDGAVAVANPNSSAFGQNSLASGMNSTALGTKAMATGINSTAIGYNASAGQYNSVAIGDNSATTRPQSVSIGGPISGDRNLTNLAPGILPDDAVNVSQLQAVQTEERRGIAALSAMPPMVTPTQPGKYTVAIGGGGFHGQYGMGITGTYRLPTVTPAYVGASYSNGGGNESVVRIFGAMEF
jgi:trimeric autotransporter adhesin